MKYFYLTLACMHIVTINAMSPKTTRPEQKTISPAKLYQQYGLTSQLITSPDQKSNPTSLVLSKDNEAIGFTVFSPKSLSVLGNRSCHIHFLWVHKNFRHKGLGSALLSTTINNLETSGCTEIFLNAIPSDPQDIEDKGSAFKILKQYYQRFGFKEVTPGSDEMKRTSSPSHTSKN